MAIQHLHNVNDADMFIERCFNINRLAYIHEFTWYRLWQSFIWMH